MNAVTRSPEGEDHFRNVQVQVFKGRMQKESIPADRMYTFIVSNAPLFRFFATHLPDELTNLWDTANTDESSRIKLEEQYEHLRQQMQRVFEQYFDADTQTAMTEAVENGDIATAERILETHSLMLGRTEE